MLVVKSGILLQTLQEVGSARKNFIFILRATLVVVGIKRGKCNACLFFRSSYGKRI